MLFKTVQCLFFYCCNVTGSGKKKTRAERGRSTRSNAETLICVVIWKAAWFQSVGLCTKQTLNTNGLIPSSGSQQQPLIVWTLKQQVAPQQIKISSSITTVFILQCDESEGSSISSFIRNLSIMLFYSVRNTKLLVCWLVSTSSNCLQRE